jgi:CRP/FNR family transcriptional regulator, cyclic AMP receptor protein
MSEEKAANDYFIWGIDDAPYGPVELPVLVEWLRDERVLPDTWVFARRNGTWQRAASIPELKELFGPQIPAAFAPVPASVPVAPMMAASAPAGIKPGSLRRIKILAGMSDAQLDQLARFIELQCIRQWSLVVKQGDPGDAMFMVMDGELRARTVSGGKETILATFGPGEFFGDMSLFDQGPRSADVVANVDSNVLKLSAAAFDRLVREAPNLAAPFLQATARTLAARIRADNKRLDRITQQFRSSAG